MDGHASRVLPHLRRRVRRALLVVAIALPSALAGAPAAQAVCNPTYPAFGDLTQPADTCPPVPSFTVNHTQVLPGETVSFDGSGSLSDDPGGITEYTWDFGDGTPPEVHGPGDATTSHAYAAQGSYDVTLTVKDAGTPSGVVSPPTAIAVTQPPVAQLDVTPNSIEVGQNATLNATGSSDPDGSIVRYDWDYEGDGSYDASTTTSSSPHVYPTTGSFTPKVRVVDNDGATDAKSTNLTVHDPPVVAFTASASLVPPGGTVNFDASGSSSSHPGGITEYAWDFNGDGTFVSSGTSPTTSHVYPTKGYYSPKLRITDGANPSGVISTPKTITVTATPIAQLAVAPSTAVAGQAITLDAGGSSDPDGSIVRYDWDYEGDGSYDTSTTTPSVSKVYPNRGTFTPKVRVVDDFGIVAVTSASLVVNTATSSGGGGTDPGSGSPAGAAESSSGPTAFAAKLLGSSIQKVKLVSRTGLAVQCSANRAATCTLRLQVSARDARRLGLRPRKGRPVQIGTARVTVTRGRAVSVRFNLTARVKRALKRVRTLRLSVLGTAADATGQRVSLTRVVLVRR